MVKRCGGALALLYGVLLWSLAAVPAAAVDANSCGYNQGPGGWYKANDRSGPYAVDGNCNAVLLGGAGTASSSGTTTQAPLARSASVVTLPANTPTQVAAAGLKSFGAQVQGTNPVVVGYDNTVCTGTGITLSAGSGSSPGQTTFEYPASSTAYWACSVAGSSLAVVRGQ